MPIVKKEGKIYAPKLVAKDQQTSSVCLSKVEPGKLYVVRKDLEFNERYGDNTFVRGMEGFLGKVVMPVDITSDYRNFNIQDNGYGWTAQMMEKEINIQKVLKQLNSVMIQD